MMDRFAQFNYILTNLLLSGAVNYLHGSVESFNYKGGFAYFFLQFCHFLSPHAGVLFLITDVFRTSCPLWN